MSLIQTKGWKRRMKKLKAEGDRGNKAIDKMRDNPKSDKQQLKKLSKVSTRKQDAAEEAQGRDTSDLKALEKRMKAKKAVNKVGKELST